MAIFRDLSKHKNGTSDRVAGDRTRHRDLVRDAIKEHLPDIISEEAIIGKGAKNTVKIPVRSLKEWRFKYGPRDDGVGQSEEAQQGDEFQIGGKKPGKGDQAGDQDGETIIEIDVDMDYLIEMMFEDLELPFLDEKKLSELKVETHTHWKGLKPHGIEPRLDLEASYIEKLTRQMASKRAKKNLSVDVSEEFGKLAKKFPFRDEDLLYHSVATKQEPQSNAVIFALMDVSGSMGSWKKYLAKAFLFLLYRFIKLKYQNVEIVFIAHHTKAFEVPEADFFHLGESGGTMISSAPALVLKLIETRYPPHLWNIYSVHCSDGDNYSSDNSHAVETYKALLKVANLVGFVEIAEENSQRTLSGAMGNILAEAIEDPHFQIIRLQDKQDVWSGFREFMKCDKGGS